MAPTVEVKRKKGVDLGALLDAGDGAVVTLVAGQTQLAAHRAVLTARSPVFEAMFSHDMLEGSTGVVSIPDVEGPVLRQLLAYCYTLRAPQLPAVAPQLLAAADKYDMLALKSMCEQQVAAQLTNENAAASAVLAVRHSCPKLTEAAVAFIRGHGSQALATKGWADATIKQPQDLIQVTQLLDQPSAKSRISAVAATVEIEETAGEDLGTLLDAEDGAMVTLVAGEIRLVVHRAVLASRSPVLKAMFHDDTMEDNSGQISIPDTEGPVLRKLLDYCYTLQVPEPLCMSPQLLVAADKYGLSCLKAACEQQVATDLTVRNAAAAAVLAVRHSCPDLTVAAINFIKAHFIHVVGTQGWADMMHKQTKDLIKVSQLLAEPPAEINAVTAIKEIEETAGEDLGTLLDAGDGAMVTLVAGEARIVVDRAVLASRSPVLEAMFHDDTMQANSGQITIPDTEGPVLRKLLDYCHTLQVPEPLCMAPQLLVAADKFGLSCLKAACERQVATDLSVRNAAAAAVLAVRHSCPDLTVAAVDFIKAHFIHVVGTRGWADMMHKQIKDLIKVSQLLAEPPAEIKSLPAEEKGRRLIEAAKKGALEEVLVLLASGADLGITDGEGWNPLHFASGRGHSDIARCLLDSGAEVDARNSSQLTPLHFAAYKGQVAVMRLLAAASADLDAKDKKGRTALHWAARAGHAEAVRLLLQLGADMEVRDDQGRTPLEFSRLEKHQEVIELLT